MTNSGKALELLFRLLTKSRGEQVEQVDVAQAELCALAPLVKIDEHLERIRTTCGSNLSYQYPTAGQLNITYDLLVADDRRPTAQFFEKLAPAVEDSRQRNGHIQMLLTMTRFEAAEVLERRNRVSTLTNEIIECYLRVNQIDAFIELLFEIDPDREENVADFANLCCQISN
ncbi:MAG: hypothetical protein JWN70_1744 [Planctomycetaceae bacterium]|nr:hypothetical protein [Planctomycetaceae bacterium]